MKKSLLIYLTLFTSILCAQRSISNEIREQVKKEIEGQLKPKQSIFKKISSKVRLFGDIRVRPYEQDWDVSIARKEEKEGFTELRDRGRMRLRFRLNIEADITNNVRIHSRFRTGFDQTDYITAGGNDESEANLIIDKLYAKFHKSDFWLTLGRNSAIFESQKGLQWDIATIDGIASGYNHSFDDDTNLDLSAAYYIAEQNRGFFNNDGAIYGAQAILNTKAIEGIKKLEARLAITIAEDLPRKLPFTTIGENHVSDQAEKYAILNSGLQLSLSNSLTLALDYYKNFTKYDENPPSDYHNFLKSERDFTDETDGYAISLLLGSLSKPKSLYAGISWAHIEKYAVIDYYSQYDFNRTDEFATSDFEGWEFRLGYAVSSNFNILGRVYSTTQLIGFSDDPDEKGSAKRFRLDLNYSF